MVFDTALGRGEFGTSEVWNGKIWRYVFYGKKCVHSIPETTKLVQW